MMAGRWVGRFKSGHQQLKDAVRTGRPATTTTKHNIERIRQILKKDASVSFVSLQESLSLSNAATWVKGVSKGDSLMVVMKAHDQSRRFRVKFSPSSQISGEVSCCACIERLCKYFPVKIPEPSLTNSQQVSSTQKRTHGNGNVLFSDVTIGQLTDSLLTKPMQFPELYGRLGNGAQCEFGNFIKLCLADPSFPAFVEKIEQELEKIKNETILEVKLQ